jgi:mono/diheme cytochrome c family protein
MKALAVLTPALLALATGGQDGDVSAGGGAQADVAETFRARCGECHAVPDPTYATDRAWIGQLPETT